MLPKAVTKSLQVISRCNLPFTTLQPFILGSSAAISGSLSFLAGMAFSSAPFHYAVEPRRRQRRCNAASVVECARKILYCRGFLSSPKRRSAHARYKTETFVKKKIRAIQYGVGPIGASLAKLMRDKQAIEIIGAIDLDPAKAERDLGEVVGASDAPWGVKVFADPQQALDLNADVVIHATSSSLAKVMDQLL